jgi:putative acetyltransferase
MTFEVRKDDLSGDAVQGLLRFHLSQLKVITPPEHVHALDLSGLTAPGVTAWTAWDGDTIAGIGALKVLGDGSGEIKSMRTAPTHLRRGVARTLLHHLVAEARSRGWRTLHLETGRGPAFEPALALYRGHGFVQGEAFAGYEPGDFSQFFHLAL